MTDKFGQQYVVLMINNNENNALLSKYYEKITILKTIGSRSLFDKNNVSLNEVNLEWFKNNDKALASFMNN